MDPWSALCETLPSISVLLTSTRGTLCSSARGFAAQGRTLDTAAVRNAAAALKAHGGGELRFPAHKVFSRGRSSHSDTILYITIFHS